MQRSRLSLGCLFRFLLTFAQLGFNANTTEHKAYTEPLHASQAVPEPHDRYDHGQHLPRHRDSDQQKAAEYREGHD